MSFDLSENTPAKLLIKSPSENAVDISIDNATLGWSLSDIKDRIAILHPCKPTPNEQRLIHMGRFLERDDVKLLHIFRQFEIGSTQTLHLIVREAALGRSKSAPVASPGLATYPEVASAVLRRRIPHQEDFSNSSTSSANTSTNFLQPANPQSPPYPQSMATPTTPRHHFPAMTTPPSGWSTSTGVPFPQGGFMSGVSFPQGGFMMPSPTAPDLSQTANTAAYYQFQQYLYYQSQMQQYYLAQAATGQLPTEQWSYGSMLPPWGAPQYHGTPVPSSLSPAASPAEPTPGDNAVGGAAQHRFAQAGLGAVPMLDPDNARPPVPAAGQTFMTKVLVQVILAIKMCAIVFLFGQHTTNARFYFLCFVAFFIFCHQSGFFNLFRPRVRPVRGVRPAQEDQLPARAPADVSTPTEAESPPIEPVPRPSLAKLLTEVVWTFLASLIPDGAAGVNGDEEQN